MKKTNSARLIAAIMAIAAILALFTAACGKPSEPKPVENVNVNSVFDLLNESGLLPELAAVPERDLAEVYGIDASKLKQWVFAMSSNYANDAGEVAIFEANDQEYVSELAQKLQNHLDRIKAVSKDYTPQQYAKVEPAEVKTVGSFVYMVVGEDYDALMKIMKDNIG